jgi:membrane protein implicated in regulation of membrane protease activity
LRLLASRTRLARMSLLWWHWIALGLALVVLELAAPGGFYFIFFGVGALVVGLLATFDAAGPAWAQILLFSLLSLLSLALFRARLLGKLQGNKRATDMDTLVGEVGTLSDELSPGGVGKVELRGTAWSARNTSHVALKRGERCVVIRVEGLTLVVGPEGTSS